MSALFSIKDLVCSYTGDPQKPALKIQELEIKKGKLLFLLGASGSGKSTLLETLGLMNQTVASGSLMFHPEKNGEGIDLRKIWENPNAISEVRKKNYSFIFQNTNLMDNFTAYQNVCLSRMIKEDKREAEVIGQAKDLMMKVKLPLNEVSMDTLAVNLSGGQRQRVAFVRALNTDFNVLFGDEPTGNLDESNANELFEVIKSSLSDEHAAIIVSHDINLALAHGDTICVITKDPKKGYGEVLQENIFHKEDWKQSKETELALRGTIKSLYKTNLDNLSGKAENKTEDTHNFNYKQLFLRKESQALLGKGRLNLWVLSLILFFTFLAIGFANGSLVYLKNKLDSAFVNWLVIEIPSTRADHETVDFIYDQLNNAEVKKEYDIQKVSLFKIQLFFINDMLRKGAYRIQGRTIDMLNDQQLMSEFVLNQDNIIYGNDKGFKSDQDLSVIVRQDLLSDFNYPKDANFIYITKTIVDSNDKIQELKVPIPVRAIVKELPGNNQFILVENFSKFWKQNPDNPFDLRKQTANLNLFLDLDSVNATKVKAVLKDYFAKNNEYNSQVYQIEPHKGSFKEGYDLTVNHLSPPEFTNDTILFNTILQLPGLAEYKNNIVRQYFFNLNFENAALTYDEISLYFNRTDKVRYFSAYLMDNFNKKEDNDKIMVDTVKIKDKENFNYLSKVTFIICYLLLLFAAIAVCLFIFNMIKSHLNKVKMNIGTFKAIGLGDAESRNIYFKIIFMFVMASIVIGLMAAVLVGSAANYFLMQQMVSDAKSSFFIVNHFNTYTAVIVMVVSSLIISWKTISKMLMRTPGDLIYNR